MAVCSERQENKHFVVHITAISPFKLDNNQDLFTSRRTN